MRIAASLFLCLSATLAQAQTNDTGFLAFGTEPQTAHWNLQRQHKACRMRQEIPEWGQVHLTSHPKSGTTFGFKPLQMGWPEGELRLLAETPPWRHDKKPVVLLQASAKSFQSLDPAISRQAVEALRSGLSLSLYAQDQGLIPGQKISVSPVNFRPALMEFGKCQTQKGFDSQPSQDKKLPQNLVLNYATNGYNLTPAHRARLDRLVKAFHQRADTQLRVWVEGHTDNQGGQSSNINLANKRARMVRMYLISQKVPKKQIVVRAHGSLQPLNANSDDFERASNRRVTVQLALK